MIVFGTIIILAALAAFLWFVDPDGFRETRARSARERPASPGSAAA